MLTKIAFYLWHFIRTIVKPAFTVKMVHACPLTSKFLVQPSNTECGGLETAYKY